MFRDERGFSVYAIISVILLLALIFVLALPNFFNLDKSKNEEDCINNLKLTWVAATDYMKDQQKDFDGNLMLLKNTLKKGSTKDHYLETIYRCPENRDDTNYIVFGKYFMETVAGTQKANYGTIVYCNNLNKYPRHFIPKSFYENMEPTELQNYFLEDMEAISSAAGADGQRKLDMMNAYVKIWKTDPTALSRVRANPLAVRNQVIGGSTTPTP